MIGRSSPVALALLIAIGCTLAALTGCGGGEATADEIAAADAAAPRATIQPVDCSASGACK